MTEIPPTPTPEQLKDVDDYAKASEFLVRLTLTTGNGLALRAVKCLMDTSDHLRMELAASIAQVNHLRRVCDRQASDLYSKRFSRGTNGRY